MSLILAIIGIVCACCGDGHYGWAFFWMLLAWMFS
jgi:hypothetical protein